MTSTPHLGYARLSTLILALLSFSFLSACGPAAQEENEGAQALPPVDQATAETSVPSPTPLLVWMHAGPADERNALREYIHRFNTMQGEVQVDLIVVAPEEDYHDELQAAARAGQLPDIVQINAPHLYQFVAQEHLLPLNDLLSADLQHDLLPSVVSQGTYNDKLYSVPLADDGIGLFLNPARLYGINFRLPRSVRTAWTAQEFDDLLARAFAHHDGEPVLDLKINYGTDWLAHIVAPLLNSAGVALVDPETQRASGSVNSDEAVEVLSMVQSWFEKGYVDPNEDDQAFTSGRVAFSWSGHWDFVRYDQALEGSFGVVPVPHFGAGSRTAHGGWGWSITSESENPESAARFLEFILESDQIIELTELTGAVPARRDAVGRSSHYGPHLKLETLSRQLDEGFGTRPKTPALPAIMAAFQASLEEIIAGADVRATLDQLAETIDQEIGQQAVEL